MAKKEDYVRELETYFVKRDEHDLFWHYSNPENLLLNGDFETWSAGAAAAPDDWTLTGAAATVARSATRKICEYAAAVTRVGADCYLEQELTCYSHLVGLFVALGCWVYATVADRVRLGLDDGVGQSYSDYHPGDSIWRYLTVVRQVDAGATKVEGRCQVDTGDTTGIFDGVILVVGQVPRAFAPKPEAAIGVPSGAIVMFAEACPTGWTRFAALDGKVGRGAATYGGMGGSETHTHTLVASGGLFENRDDSMTSESNWPPYLNVVWCQKD